MKVAILGNSHVACLIMAHRQDPSLLGTDIDPVFFAAPGKGMSGMQLDGDRLVPASSELKDQIALTSGGLDAIRLPDFEAFILIAMGYMVPMVPRSYSSAVIGKAMDRRIANSILWQLADRISEESDKPVLCGHIPLSANAPVQDDLLSYEEVMALYGDRVEQRGLSLIRQPEETRRDDLFTKAEFTKGSRRLRSEEAHPEDDISHMNAEYGAIYLRHCATLLRQSA